MVGPNRQPFAPTQQLCGPSASAKSLRRPQALASTGDNTPATMMPTEIDQIQIRERSLGSVLNCRLPDVRTGREALPEYGLGIFVESNILVCAEHAPGV